WYGSRSCSINPGISRPAGRGPTLPDAPQGGVDLFQVERLRVELLAGPLAQLVVFRVAGILQGLQQVGGPPDAAGALRRPRPPAGQASRVADARLRRQDLLD